MDKYFSKLQTMPYLLMDTFNHYLSHSLECNKVVTVAMFIDRNKAFFPSVRLFRIRTTENVHSWLQ